MRRPPLPTIGLLAALLATAGCGRIGPSQISPAAPRGAVNAPLTTGYAAPVNQAGAYGSGYGAAGAQAGYSGLTSITYSEVGSFANQGQAPGLLLAPKDLVISGSAVMVLDLNSSALVHTGVLRQYDASSGAFKGKCGDYSKWLGLKEMSDSVRALTLDSQGRFDVLDSAKKIWRFKPDGSKNTTMALSVTDGVDISTDPVTGNIYVASSSGGVVKMGPDGDSPTTFGSLNGCQALAATRDGLWVMSGGKLSKLTQNGSPIGNAGGYGVASLANVLPFVNAAVGVYGAVAGAYGAANSGANGTSTYADPNAQVYPAPAAGASASGFGPSGAAGQGQDTFSAPSHMAIDPTTGDLLVVDKGTRNVYVYNSIGLLVGKVGDGVFETPVSVSVDMGGNVFVLDQGKKLVYKFAPGARH